MNRLSRCCAFGLFWSSESLSRQICDPCLARLPAQEPSNLQGDQFHV